MKLYSTNTQCNHDVTVSFNHLVLTLGGVFQVNEVYSNYNILAITTHDKLQRIIAIYINTRFTS